MAKKKADKPHKTRTAQEVVEMSEDVETVSVPRKHFTLASIKIMKDNRGVDVTYKSVKMDGGVSSVDTHSVTSCGVPHPELIGAIESLAQYSVQACGLVKYLNSPEISKEYGQKALLETIESFSPTGISISGQDAKKGAIITGVWNCFGNYKISLNTPRIMLDQQQFEFEDELNISVEEIEDEVFAYLFKNKRAQLGLFSGDETDNEDFNEDGEN